MDSRNVYEVLLKTFERAQSSGFTGYDPYDVKAVRTIGKLSTVRYLGFGVDRILSLVPRLSRRLLSVKPAVNPKGLALFSLGSASLFRTTKDRQWRTNGLRVLDEMLSRSTKTAHGEGWGYPFLWNSRQVFPAGTPSGVVTSFCLQAICDWYEIEKDHRHLEPAEKAVRFLTKDLNQHETADKSICFSYTPLDHLKVHNANVLVSAALNRVARILNDNSWGPLVSNALRYTLSQQNADGSWDYYGREEDLKGRIDNYHTGFILRALADIGGQNPQPSMEKAIDKGLSFYLDNLFSRGFLPRHNTSLTYPVDIHACADSICTLVRFCQSGERVQDMVERLVQWTLGHMYDGNGGFYYQYYPYFTSRMVYMRWNIAWSFYALARYLEFRSGGQ